MRVVLQPMTEEIFRTYMSGHQEEYARDRVISDGEILEGALRTVRTQQEQIPVRNAQLALINSGGNCAV